MTLAAEARLDRTFDPARAEAMAHWLAQEAADRDGAAAAAADRQGRWPGGWWVVPAVVAGLALWALIGRALLS